MEWKHIRLQVSKEGKIEKKILISDPSTLLPIFSPEGLMLIRER